MCLAEFFLDGEFIISKTISGLGALVYSYKIEILTFLEEETFIDMKNNKE